MEVLWAWLGYPVTKVFGDLDISSLALNSAYVVSNTGLDEVSVYTVLDDCIGCPYTLQQKLSSDHNSSWITDTSVGSTWRIIKSSTSLKLSRNQRSGLLCQLRPTLGEYGVYRLNVGTCELKPELEPINIYLPLLLSWLMLMFGCGIYTCIQYIINRRRRQCVDNELGNGATKEEKIATEGVKMAGLNVFRGLLVSLIIFLTSGAGGYTLLTRKWGGITLAESLFYTYVWTIGVKLPTSIDRAFEMGHSKCQVFTDVLKRSFSLVFIGLVIDSTVQNQPDRDVLGIWCPLQQMAIAYFITALAYALTVHKFEMQSKSIFCKAIANIVSLLWCWVITGFLFAVQIICITTFISFNCQSNIGLEYPNSDPSNITEVSNSCTRHSEWTQLANQIFMATPEKMLYINSYFGFTKGFMGILAITIQCMIGLKAGAVYRHFEGHRDRVKLWCIWAIIFAACGIAIANLSKAVQLNLWPLSTTILLSTISMLLFTIVYILVECTKIVEISVLRSAGVTSLAFVFGHLLFSRSIPFYWGVSFSSHIEYLLQSFWIVILWLVIGYAMEKKQVKFSV